MRKFKLIKEYPCSGKLGTIKEWDGEDVICFNMPAYPEYWEEVKEFPKIISYRSKSDDESIFDNPKYFNILKDDKWVIYQVAVSENEVFTLGDLVTYNYRANYAPWIIDNFFIRRADGKILARSKSNSICEIVSEIKKAPELLFVTEDGIEIYEGDDYWFYWTKNPASKQYINIPYKVFNAEKLDRNSVYSPSAKFFSTKEAAEKHINENKPIYSKKQVKEALEESYFRESYILDTPCCQIDRFKEDIFKQKLNL